MMQPARDTTLYRDKPRLGRWIRSGEPMIWLNAAAVSLSVLAVAGLLLLLAVRGFSHFWPRDIVQATISYQGSERDVLGEVVETLSVPGEQLREAGFELSGPGPFFDRTLLKQGNRDAFGSDFVCLC